MYIQILKQIVITSLMLFLVLQVKPGVAEASYHKRALVVAKVLSYESTLKRRAGAELNITILYRAGSPASEAEAKSWQAAFGAMGSTRVQGLPIRVTRVASSGDIASLIVESKSDVLLVAGGLEATGAAIRSAARSASVLTVGSSRQAVKSGMTLGVFITRGKPKIVVNLAAAKRERVKLSSQLLRLAEVLR